MYRMMTRMTYHWRSLEDTACYKEGAPVPDARFFGSQHHCIAGNRYQATCNHEWPSGFDPVGVCRSGKYYEEGAHVGSYGEKLSLDARVAKSFDDRGKEQ